MNVKELIDELKNFNPGLDIKIYCDFPNLRDIDNVFVEKDDSDENVLVLD